MAVANQVAHHFLTDEAKNVDFVFTVAGFSFSGAGQNAGIAFKPFCATGMIVPASRMALKHIAGPAAMQKFGGLPSASGFMPWCRRRCPNWAIPPLRPGDGRPWQSGPCAH